MNSKTEWRNVTVEFYKERDREDYTDFLLNDLDSNIYHTIEWKELIEKHFGFTSYYLIARTNSDEIGAVLPVFYLKNLCGKRLDSIPLSIYGGALGEEVYVKRLVETVFELKRDLNCRYVIIRQHPNKYYNVFTVKGMKKTDVKWTQMIKIKNPKILWNEIYKSNRNSIRKAIKNNVRVQEIDDKKELSEFYRLELANRRRIGLITPPFDFFESAWDELYPQGYMKVFVTRYKEIVIASCLIYIFNGKVIYAHANSDKRFLGFRPNNLQLWRVIEWCYSNGYELLDLGATDLDNEGLFFFKSSFNTFNIPFAYYYWPSDSITIDDTALGKIGKKCIQKTPTFVLKIVCPYLLKKFG